MVVGLQIWLGVNMVVGLQTISVGLLPYWE